MNALQIFPGISLSRLNRFLVVILVIFLSGCQKDNLVLSNGQSDENSKLRLSTVTTTDINNWLKSEKSEQTPFRNQFIDNVINNLLLDQKYTTHFRERENLIVVPVADVYFSQHIKGAKKPLQYLLIIEDKNGKIRRGDIMLFYPLNDSIKNIPANSFDNFFNNATFSFDGTLILLNMSDKRQYEMDFKDNSLKESRMWKKEEATASTASGNNTETQTCTNWYLVTTYYYADGHTETDWEFLGTTCSGCVPNEVCDHLEGEGGGSTTSPPEAKQVQVSFVVASKSSSYESWQMIPFYNLSGLNYPSDASLNYFTSIPASTSSPGNSNSAMLYGAGTPGTMHTVSWHPWYIVFSLIHNNVGLRDSDKTAFADFNGRLTFPQQNSRVEGHRLAKSWPAAVVLH